MKTGQVITFYSYKGGVGRTMALANIGTMLSHWGYRVLMVDWDLEAPGLENYFKDSISVEEIKKRKGLVDLLHPDEADKNLTWGKIALTIKTEISKTPIHLITAGRRDENYYDKVRDFDINTFYEKEDGYDKIEELRNQWKASYDFVLIDSRTGITDIGGICTIQMPDALVMLFTPTEIGFTGVVDVAKRALAAQQKLSNARYLLNILPIPTRMDSSEFGLMRDWMNRFARDLKDIYKGWLPLSVNSRDLLDTTKVPYVPYFSYGEKLPIIEQGTTDATGLGYAYESIAALIANQFIDVELFVNDRVLFLQKANLNGNGNIKKISEISVERSLNIVKPKKVYLSYADDSLEIVDKMRGDLVRRGYNVYSYREFLKPGKNWKSETDNAIDQSDIFLAFLSQEYDEDEENEYELDSVENVNKLIVSHNKAYPNKLKNEIYIIPVYIEEDVYVPTELRDIIGIYMYVQPYELTLQEIIQAIESA